MGWFGKESPLFGRQSKIGGMGRSQYPDAPLGAIPNWGPSNEYIKDQEVMNPATGAYYRANSTHYASDVFNTDLLAGKWTLIISASPGISSVSYSNVAFVDPTVGNNATAVLGRFDLPWRTIPEAITAASSGANATRRGLVWIRKGNHSATFTMTNFVDIHCDAGVLFNSGQTTINNVNASIYGFARFQVAGTAMFFDGNCIGSYEFDSIFSTAAAIIFNSTCAGTVLVKGNAINTTIAASLGITIRGSVNVTMDIKREITGFAEVINFRFYSGKTVITCPKIKLLTGDTFGGDFKSTVKMYECTGADIIVNGDLINEDPVYYMGISGMVVFWNGPTVKFTLNGDIYGNGCPGVGMYDGNVALCTINGNISSDIRNVYSTSGELIVKQSFISLSTTAGSFNPVFLEGTAKASFVNCQFFNEVVDSDTVSINLVDTVDLNLYNCVSEQSGTGDFVNSTIPIAIQIINSMSTHSLGVGVTNSIASNGFFQDANIKAIQF